MIVMLVLAASVIAAPPPPQRFVDGDVNLPRMWIPVPPIPYPSAGKSALDWRCELKSAEGRPIKLAGDIAAIPPPLAGEGRSIAHPEFAILKDASHSYAGRFVSTYSGSIASTYGIMFLDGQIKKYFEINTFHSKQEASGGLFEIAQPDVKPIALGKCVITERAGQERG